MIIGVVVFIFCILGIYGYFDNNVILTYIGLVLSVIEDIWGIYRGQQKGFSTGWIALVCAIVMTIKGNVFLESLAVCMCFENVISFAFGIVLLVVAGITITKVQKKDKKKIERQEEKTPVEIYYEKEIESSLKYDYEKLLDIIKIGAGVTDLDSAIQTFFGFYMEKNIPIPLELVITKDKTTIEKYENLLKILEMGIGTTGINNVQKKLFDFYKSKGIVFPFDKI